MKSAGHCGRNYRSIGASTVLFLGFGVVLSIFMGCGDDGPTACGTCGVENELVFTRADSTEVVFPSSARAYVWCGDWDTWDTEGEVPALRIGFGTRNVEDHNWMLTAVLADIELDQPISFPATTGGNEPRRVLLFLNDGPNELSSFEGESSGTITFHSLPCPGGGSVEFTIDAVLGSEYWNLGPVAVTGYFRHYLTGLPRETE
ncbi:hypothetical protein ACFL2Z_03670 [Candidatus Eisenbacteria bacterium]|uniref:Lipoprotein n=1 Tax=Eiseniibacteriota bacterium TaxID=2212470 RepID=A0ABV6YQ02_UNCEI